MNVLTRPIAKQIELPTAPQAQKKTFISKLADAFLQYLGVAFVGVIFTVGFMWMSTRPDSSGLFPSSGFVWIQLTTSVVASLSIVWSTRLIRDAKQIGALRKEEHTLSVLIENALKEGFTGAEITAALEKLRAPDVIVNSPGRQGFRYKFGVRPLRTSAQDQARAQDAWIREDSNLGDYQQVQGASSATFSGSFS